MIPSRKSQKTGTGFLVTFEGIEGSGKSTQLDLLADYLIQKGRAVLKTREPGGTPIGNAVRSILLDPTRSEMTAETELYLILAGRAQHVTQVIRPAIAEGQIVLCDRFFHTTVAYQGYGRGLPIDFVETTALSGAGGLMPRIAFFLDLDVRLALSRLAQRGALNRIDREAAAFHERVREGYIAFAQKHKEITRTVDGSRPAEAVAREIRRHMDELGV
jgi:dTMP kinase